MRLIVSLALIASCALASAAEPQLILRRGAFNCPASQAGAVEAIVDAADPEHMKAAFVDAVMHGRCTGALASSAAITEVRTVRTPNGHAYSCFREPELGNAAFCTLSTFVTTIAAEVSHRRGDYTVTREDAKGLEATCAEGGIVVIEKHEDHWNRGEVVFPPHLDPPFRAVPPDRESALRDGCRGVDYLR